MSATFQCARLPPGTRAHTLSGRKVTYTGERTTNPDGSWSYRWIIEDLGHYWYDEHGLWMGRESDPDFKHHINTERFLKEEQAARPACTRFDEWE